jgi:hexosaminidase
MVLVLKRIALVAVLAVTLSTGVAHALPYPLPQDAVFVANASSLQVGKQLAAAAQVFDPGSTVTFTFESTPVVLGTSVANTNGVASVNTTVPNTTLGEHLVRAVGTFEGEAVNLTTSVTVVGATATAAPLPRTGSDSMNLWRIGTVAVLLGGLFVALSRKRRVRYSAAA